MASRVQTRSSTGSTPAKVASDQQTTSTGSAAQKTKPRTKTSKSDHVGHGLLLAILLLTVALYPRGLLQQQNADERIDYRVVFYYGWITAVSTGVGVLPFVFVPNMGKIWLGIANAVAGGMMIAASYSLFTEGLSVVSHDSSAVHAIGADPRQSLFRTTTGALTGIAFILFSKRVLEHFGGDDISFGELQGADAQKFLLILFVMTLHSASEGIGIGVSFCGKTGAKLGQYISLSLAVHNIPEGLAVALVSTSKRVSVLRSGLWAVFTSLPQPLMAIPAFLLVDAFKPLQSAGMGFAGGAMAYVAVFELLVEAAEDCRSWRLALFSGGLACLAMLVAQFYIHEYTEHTHT